MGLLEDNLRDAFARRVSAAPPVTGLAERAIAGARQARLRRTAVASVAAAVSVALVGLGVVWAARDRAPAPLPGGPTSSVEPTPSPSAVGRLPIDVLLGDRIVTTEGDTVSLVDLGAVRGAWRVPEGWLVISGLYTPGTTQRLWLVPPTGPASELVSGEVVWAGPGSTSRPGAQVSWVDGGRLHLGTYAGGAVGGVVSTPAPQVDISGLGGDPSVLGTTRPLYPQAVVGDGVVLAGTHTGAGLGFWDVWFPDRGDYVPAQSPTIEPQGATVDGERLIGWYEVEPASKEGCLGELDPDGFVPVRSRCPSPLSNQDAVFPSPDGDWWMVVGPDGASLYPAEAFWQGAGPSRSWPGITGNTGITGVGAWLPAGAWAGGAPAFAITTRTGSAYLLSVLSPQADPALVAPLPASGLVGVVPGLR